MKKIDICMIVQEPLVKGGIAAVIEGYRNSKLEENFNIYYIESYKDGGKFAKIVKGFSGYYNFLKVIIFNRPALIHIHSSFGMSFYRKLPFIYLASLINIPILNHIHGADFETFYIKASLKKQKLINKTYNKCSKLIALSDEWECHLKKIVPEEKITIVYNYSVSNFDAIIDKNNRGLNYKVLFLGEIGERKGCYDIPNIVEKVSEVFPNVKFILAGAGEIEQLTKILESKGLINNVEFPGWVRGLEKDKLLRESDIFFLPSYNEGMPMSILDAMGYGLPIISTNVGGIPKIVLQDINGFTCEPGDTNCLASYITELLMNQEKLKNMGQCSYEIVEANYSLNTHLKSLEELYCNLSKVGEMNEKPF